MIKRSLRKHLETFLDTANCATSCRSQTGAWKEVFEISFNSRGVGPSGLAPPTVTVIILQEGLAAALLEESLRVSETSFSISKIVGRGGKQLRVFNIEAPNGNPANLPETHFKTIGKTLDKVFFQDRTKVAVGILRSELFKEEPRVTATSSILVRELFPQAIECISQKLDSGSCPVKEWDHKVEKAADAAINYLTREARLHNQSIPRFPVTLPGPSNSSQICRSLAECVERFYQGGTISR